MATHTPQHGTLVDAHVGPWGTLHPLGGNRVPTCVTCACQSKGHPAECPRGPQGTMAWALRELPLHQQVERKDALPWIDICQCVARSMGMFLVQ